MEFKTESETIDEKGTEVEIGDQQSVLLKVAGLYASHLLSDINLVVGKNQYPAHRVILSASSEVFQCMLLNPQWQESKESVIHLVEDPKSCQVFPQFLKYLYTGQVRVSIETAMPLLSLADKYNIKDLIVLCRNYMSQNIAIAGSKGFLISWLQYTLSFQYHSSLTYELKNFLRLNIELVGYSRDFSDIDPNNLVVLLQQNDLVIKNEAALFDIVERYLMTKKEQIEHEESLSDEEKGSHMKSLIEGICVHIRYPMMTVSELASIPLKPIVPCSKEFFCDRMALGMSFHANQPYIMDGESNLQYTPRLYTCDNFGLTLEVDEIHNVENYKNFGACFFSLSEFPYNSNESDGEFMK
jgi:BTB/POZ domain-containing protein 17